MFSSADPEAVVQRIKEELDLHGLIHNALIYGRLKKTSAASRMKLYLKKKENEPDTIANYTKKYNKKYYEKNKERISANQKAYYERKKNSLQNEKEQTRKRKADCAKITNDA